MKGVFDGAQEVLEESAVAFHDEDRDGHAWAKGYWYCETF